jgi:radical SAM-linked protein
MSRVLLRLRKGDEVRYLSHRDMVRAFELALRRAGIPVAYSEGFNPRPRMSFGAAVGVGVTSDDERIVLETAEPQEPAEVMTRLNAQLPKGLEILAAEAVPEEGRRSGSLSELNASRFRITLTCGDVGAIERAIENILASGEVRVAREREGKVREVNIRPYIIGARVSEDDLEVCLRSSDSGGASPKDFMQAIGALTPNLSIERIHRLVQYHADD